MTSRVKFLEGYAECIAEAGNAWAWTELEVHWMLWALMEVNPSVGACVTSQIYTFPAKLDALLALMKLRQAPEALIKRVNRFTESSRAAQEARNRFAHDVWLTDNAAPDQMGRARVIARRTLDFAVTSVGLDDLKEGKTRIDESRQAVTEIRKDLMNVLPTLPQIPREARHPLSDVR